MLRCKFCEPAKKKWLELVKKSPVNNNSKGHKGQGDQVDCANHQIKSLNTEDVEAITKLENETYKLPIRLIKILENPDNWRKKCLTDKLENEGQYFYAKVHQDTLEYRNTYQYFVFRYAAPKR